VTTSTTGLSLDPDGYVAGLDGRTGRAVPATGTLLLEQVAPGSHQVALTEVAANCRIDGPNPVSVLVTAGETGEASFSVTCQGRLAFAIWGPTEGYQDIWVINADGSGRARLTHGLGATAPRWSPDGRKIAYLLTGDTHPFEPAIGVMNADGTNPVMVWREPGTPGPPSWSPDGGRLVFTFDHQSASGSGFYTMNPDGSDVRWLALGTVRGWDPAWSPDGSRIAFARARHGAHNEWLGDDVLTMSPDGTGVTPLISGEYEGFYRMAWSPDGAWIAYHTPVFGQPYNQSAVRIVSLHGLPAPYGGANLTEDGYAPVWSPDGSMIAYHYDPNNTEPEGPEGIWLIDSDGTDKTFLTYGSDPSWAPLAR
jgi:TolB protein